MRLVGVFGDGRLRMGRVLTKVQMCKCKGRESGRASASDVVSENKCENPAVTTMVEVEGSERDIKRTRQE